MNSNSLRHVRYVYQMRRDIIICIDCVTLKNIDGVRLFLL